MPDRRREIRAQLLATFRVEADEHVQAITGHLLTLDRGVASGHAADAAEAAFREVHTLKGAARSVGLTSVEALCQACESVLSRITRRQLEITGPLVSGLQKTVDAVGRLLAGDQAAATSEIVAALERAATDPSAVASIPAVPPPPRSEPPAVPSSAGGGPVDSIRVATAKLDALFRRAEELLIPRLAAEERVREVRALAASLADGAKARGRDIAPRAAEDRARELLGHLVLDRRTLSRAVDDLADELRRIRLTPAAGILDLFPRMVHDLARERGKDIEWIASGADLEVDRRVLEAVKEPLIHLVRNAIDHGVEAPDARARAGKATGGRVVAGVTPLEGGRIEIRVEDDGAGIDLVRVRAAAVRAHLLTSEEAGALPDDRALELVYRSGLSTSPVITDLSGHGLGLAIVREQVERLGGRIRIDTRVGFGTTVRMILPATLATFRGLLIEAGAASFLLPMDSVERAIRVAPDEVRHVQGHATVRWNGHSLSVARLHDLLGLVDQPEAPTPERRMLCVVVRAAEERAGLIVDEILGDREVLVKEFGPPLVRVRNVAGAGLLGTGRVALILRPGDLVKSIRHAPHPSALNERTRESRHQAVVLVVDDSITTRTMETSLLEASGYQVRVAVDGIEAWTLLKSEAIDLVVSDVDMPRMDGFELTARIRADQALADLPVVLVTALESREDKERGIEVGANAYVIKSSFDQSNLLDIIGRLL
jgi:two-component system chemotaxis sensor kinase CheA